MKIKGVYRFFQFFEAAFIRGDILKKLSFADKYFLQTKY